MKSEERAMDGIINLNKPAGISSHQAVVALRRLVPGTRVGHGGTLDPAAGGVLPLCLGRATRIAGYLFDLRKGYRASIALGVATSTGDAEGAVTFRKAPPCLEREDIEKLFRSLTGTQLQEVPAYAAVKHRGRPLYDYARRGEKVPVKRRTVEIYRLELISSSPAGIACEIECSRGTYIRALAIEIGKRLGCGAHLHALERLFVGPFTIETAVTPERLSTAAAVGELEKFLQTMDRALFHLEALTVSEEAVADLKAGRTAAWKMPDPGKMPAVSGFPVRIYDPGGRFRALARFEKDSSGSLLLKTEKFLSP